MRLFGQDQVCVLNLFSELDAMFTSSNPRGLWFVALNVELCVQHSLVNVRNHVRRFDEREAETWSHEDELVMTELDSEIRKQAAQPV